jgi:peroxiredoxin
MVLQAVPAQVQTRPDSPSAEAEKRALKVGLAPSFSLPGRDGGRVSLASLLDKGPVVLVFYRGAWCPYCNTQLAGYQQGLNRILAKGATLVAVSPQLPEKSASMAEKGELRFPVLSDVGLKVARSFGLVFKAPASYGFLPDYNGDSSGELPLAATYVIGKDGRILKAFVDQDYKKRASLEDILAALP